MTFFFFENCILEIRHRYSACFKKLPSSEVMKTERASGNKGIISKVLRKHRRKAHHFVGDRVGSGEGVKVHGFWGIKCCQPVSKFSITLEDNFHETKSLTFKHMKYFLFLTFLLSFYDSGQKAHWLVRFVQCWMHRQPSFWQRTGIDRVKHHLGGAIKFVAHLLKILPVVFTNQRLPQVLLFIR